MYNVKDTIESRTSNFPLRKINSLDLDHVALVVNKQNVYSATSLEARSNLEKARHAKCCKWFRKWYNKRKKRIK